MRHSLMFTTFMCGFVGAFSVFIMMIVFLMSALWPSECSTPCSGQIMFMRADVFCLARAEACTASRTLNTLACLLPTDLVPCHRPAASVADLVHEFAYEGASAMCIACLLTLYWVICVLLDEYKKAVGKRALQAMRDTLIVESLPDSVRLDAAK